MKKSLTILCLSTTMFLSCTPSPEPIDYGSDMCNFCKMTIVDPQHGAEAVTKKGKVFTYDSIECLIHDLKRISNNDYAYLLVNDYESPTSLIESQSSYYLISKAIPSPMGAYLSGFSTRVAAEKMMESKGGQVFDWTDIQRYINSQESIVEME